MKLVPAISILIVCITSGQCRSSFIDSDGKDCSDYIQWHVGFDLVKPGTPRCGQSAPPINGVQAICNPEDDFSHCCSPAGFCGAGPDFCDCKGCQDFRNISVVDLMKKSRCPEEPLRQTGTNETRADVDEVKPEATCGPTAKKVCEINKSNRSNETERSTSKHCWCETNYRRIAKIGIVLCLALSGCIGIVLRKFGMFSKCDGSPTLQISESAR